MAVCIYSGWVIAPTASSVGKLKADFTLVHNSADNLPPRLSALLFLGADITVIL